MSRGISGTESVVACGDDDDARGIDWRGAASERGMSVSAISRTSRAMIPISRYVRFPRVVLDDTVTDRTETFMRSEDRLLGLNVRRYALPCSNPDMALSEKVLLPAIFWDVFLA